MKDHGFQRKEEHVDSYIIRIYRRNRKDPTKVAGVVEVIGKEGKKGFLDPKSLWAILTAPWGQPRSRPDVSGGRRKHPAMTLGEIMNRIAKGKH